MLLWGKEVSTGQVPLHSCHAEGVHCELESLLVQHGPHKKEELEVQYGRRRTGTSGSATKSDCDNFRKVRPAVSLLLSKALLKKKIKVAGKR